MLPRALIFVTVVLAISFGAHRFVWMRLVRDPGWTVAVTRTLTAVLVLLAIAPIAAMVLTRFLPRETTRPLISIAMAWLGSLLYVLLGLGLTDAATFVVEKVVSVPFNEGKRVLFARLSAGFVAVVSTGIAAGGVANVLSGAAVKRIRVSLAKLPSDYDGYRIVQITDVHVGPTIGRHFLEKVVHDVNALEPDLIVITGDLVDGSVASLVEHVAPLGRLRSRRSRARSLRRGLLCRSLLRRGGLSGRQRLPRRHSLARRRARLRTGSLLLRGGLLLRGLIRRRTLATRSLLHARRAPPFMVCVLLRSCSLPMLAHSTRPRRPDSNRFSAAGADSRAD